MRLQHRLQDLAHHETSLDNAEVLNLSRLKTHLVRLQAPAENATSSLSLISRPWKNKSNSSVTRKQEGPQQV